jgi:hypothetical protein
MRTSLTLNSARFPETGRLLVASLLVFALGSASGFVLRAVSAPTAASTQLVAVVRVTEPCPSGRHAVVWYSAKAWGCVTDTQDATRE